MTTESDPSILDVWTENPGATALAIGLGVLVGAAITFGVLKDRERVLSNEPPIRVRNGSLEMELLHQTLKFQEEQNSTDKKKWRIETDPERTHEDYVVLITPTDPARCKGFIATGDRIEFIYGNGEQTIEVKATGKRTKITARPNALNNPKGQLLTYGTSGGFITTIKVGNTDFCTFTERDDNLDVVIFD